MPSKGKIHVAVVYFCLSKKSVGKDCHTEGGRGFRKLCESVSEVHFSKKWKLKQLRVKQ